MNFSIHNCTTEHFKTIIDHIKKFELDDRLLGPEQFLVALHNNTIVGFGRIREFEDCSELCSLGVIEPERHKGIGKALTLALIQKAKQSLYLVCIIPSFFEPMGFSICTNYPEALASKLNYCTNQLVVPEQYVVMVYKSLR